MHPVGPRSPQVYWVRRVSMVVLAVVVVIALVWFVASRGRNSGITPAADSQSQTGTGQMTGVLAPSDSESGQISGAGSSRTSSGVGDAKSTGKTTGTSETAKSTAKASQTKSTAKATGKTQTKSATTTTGKASQTKATGKASQTKATGTSDPAKTTPAKATATTTPAKTTPATTTPAKATAKTTPKTTPTTPPPPSTDAQGRLICPDSSMTLTSGTGQNTYRVGDQPILSLTVTNSGSVACVRDLSGSLQVFTVFTTAGARVWSTADCFPGTGTDVRMLDPGEPVTYNVKWSGTTSNPGCTAARTQVSAGSYTVVAAVGALKSKAHPFTVTG